MTIIGYTRCSYNPQKVKISPAAQQAAIRNKSLELGFGDVELIHEDLSAKKLDRPGIQQVIAKIKNLEVSVLLIWKLNRISRNMRDLLTMQAVCAENDVRLVSISENYDSHNQDAQSLFKLQVLASVSEVQRSVVSENIENALKLKHAKGLPLSANVPYGYTFTKEKLVVDVDKAAQVKTIFEMYLQGLGYKAIVHHLNQENVTVSLVKRILTTETYTGYFSNKFGRIRGTHDAIIMPEIFSQVQKLRQSKKTADKGIRKGFILRGKMSCPYCDKTLTVQIVWNKGKQYSYYCCRSYVASGNCCPFTINAQKLETVVINEIQSFLLESEVWQQIKGEVQRLAKNHHNVTNVELKKLDTRQSQLFTYFQQRVISSDELKKQLTELSSERTSLLTKKQQTVTESAIRELIKLLDCKENADWTGEFIANLVEHVVLTKEKKLAGIKLRHLAVDIMKGGSQHGKN